MKKIIFFIITLVAGFTLSVTACDTTAINKQNWSVIFVDSEEPTGEGANNGHAIHCIDNDPTTFWHTEYQSTTPPYPHEIQIDLGASYPVNGFSLLTRANNGGGRIADFALYLTNDTTQWGDAQVINTLQYPNTSSAQQTAYLFFGAVNARYFRLVALTATTNTSYVMLAELDIYQDTVCGASGQNNQYIHLTAIPKQLNTAQPITIEASASSGLPLSYAILSGPATLTDSIITLTGDAGMVNISVSQSGNDQYYPIARTLSFQVVDLADYYPEITTKLTSGYPIQMPSLMPYLLHASATIDQAEYLSITSIDFAVEGTVHQGIKEQDNYKVFWQPEHYGDFDIVIIATASNGNIGYDTIRVTVTDEIETTTVATLENAVIDLGTIGSQWYTNHYDLPQSVGAYSNIIAHFSVSCPSVPGGCDDWDRIGWVQVKAPDGSWVELFRYITPYGVACSHSVDVTDFQSLLQGKTDIRMYIETWGTGGWQLNLNLEYVAGVPEYPYSMVEQMWQGTYNFGDYACLQPMDTVIVKKNPLAEKMALRLVTTGHGWNSDYNTGNAAEFYHAIHHLKVNEANAFEQDLWWTCNPNPDGCSPQNGTWRYNRAGWCPGTIARTYSFDFTPYMNQAPFHLEYIFQESYVDLCHPNHPDCITGVTCSNCNEGFNPHYRIGGYMIQYSHYPLTTAIDSYKKPASQNSETFDIDIYPNPAHHYFSVNCATPFKNATACILDIKGEILYTYTFADENALTNYRFDVSSLSKGIYFLQLYTKTKLSAEKIIVQ